MGSMTNRKVIAGGVIIVAAAMVVGCVTGSIDKTAGEWENLEVLPRDVTRDELIPTMKSIAQGIGERCSYCHVGEGMDLDEYDFAADEKPEKRAARTMLAMVIDVNGDWLPRLGPIERGEIGVTCWTCHRGSTHPEKDHPLPAIAGPVASHPDGDAP